ncbi:hypothetical protein KUCAC02_013087, partial [Chaenocephalus aceratus]
VTVFVSKNNSLTIWQQCLYGCYVHSSIIPTFHRRCYWLLQHTQVNTHNTEEFTDFVLSCYCGASAKNNWPVTSLSLTLLRRSPTCLTVSEPSVPDSLCTIGCVHMRFAGSSLSTAEQQGDWSSQSGIRERCRFRAAQVMCDDGAELSGPDSHQIRPDYARLPNEYFTEINHG